MVAPRVVSLPPHVQQHCADLLQAGSPAGGYSAAALSAELASLAATNPAAVAAATSKLLDPNHAAFADTLRRSSGLSTPRGARVAAPSPALSPSEAAAARWADFILGSSAAARQAQSRSQSPPSPGQQGAACVSCRVHILNLHTTLLLWRCAHVVLTHVRMV